MITSTKDVSRYYCKRKRHFNDWKASAVSLYHTFRQKESLSFVKSSLRYCSGDRSSNHQCPGSVPGNRNDPVHRNLLPCLRNQPLFRMFRQKTTDRNITILRPAKTTFQPTEAHQTIQLPARHSVIGKTGLFPRS